MKFNQLVAMFFAVVTIVCCPFSWAAQSIPQKPVTLEAAEIRQTLQQLIEVLAKEYIVKDNADVIAQVLNYKMSHQEFNNRQALSSFQTSLAILLRDISGDANLDIVPTVNEWSLGQTQHLSATASSVLTAKVLAGNIGYLTLPRFEQAAKTLLPAAMSTLQNTKAIIIDLREAEGDSLVMAQLLLSYFTEPDVPLFDNYYQQRAKVEQLNALASTSEKFKHDFPVYLLTSPFNVGISELVSYSLKHMGKAVIIGKPTMGMAVIKQTFPINPWLKVSIPVAVPINPITKGNWQEQGVLPDYDIDVIKSFDFAFKIASDHLLLEAADKK
ncbi:S41 family peptidase [Colwellia sp. MEBiC06753]